MSILPNRIIGTVGEHAGFPVEALNVSHCGQWLASCSHDQLVKFSDLREVVTQQVDGHRRLKRTEQKKVLSSKAAAKLDFFGDLDPARGESSRPDKSGLEDNPSGSESDTAAEGGDCGKTLLDEQQDVATETASDSSDSDEDEDSDSSVSQQSSDDDDDDDD